MRILISCANGSGTSLMLQQTATKALNQLGYTVVDGHHTSIAEGKSIAKSYDVVFTSLNFVNMFDDVAASGTPVIGVKNVMSVPEVKKLIEESTILEKFPVK
ncbi:PTS sugar transporter subunit IIB [Atopobium deltae]|nr:PTS sugar transporter subunit IIB [Atopobium deltae]